MDPDLLNERVGQLIRHHRKRLNLTQHQLAKRIGLSRPSIANIERGQQNILVHQLYDLASALHVSADALLPSVEGGMIPEELGRKLEEITDASV